MSPPRPRRSPSRPLARLAVRRGHRQRFRLGLTYRRLHPNAEFLRRGAWPPAGGTGGASGGSSAAWGYQLGAPPSSSGGSSGGGSSSYSGSGSYSETAEYYDDDSYGYVPYGSVSGILGASGTETYSLGWGTSASMSPGEGWTQTGSGSVAATGTYSYYYAGSGSGVVPVDDYPNMSGSADVEHQRRESGSGGGAYTYNDSFRVAAQRLRRLRLVRGHSKLTPATRTQQDGYNYQSSGSVTYDVSPEYSFTDDYDTTFSRERHHVLQHRRLGKLAQRHVSRRQRRRHHGVA